MMKAGSLVGVTDSTTAMQKLSHVWMPLGKHVVIVGGGLVGLELAEFLIERGREVCVLESGPSLGRELAIVRRWRVLHGLQEHQAQLLTGVEVESIGRSKVAYRNADGNSAEVTADSVVLAIGAEPDDSLARTLEASGFAVTRLGDSNQLGYIEGAMASGHRAGCAV
jgi:2,4-dienoyl-CoA reductase (NADPH2)